MITMKFCNLMICLLVGVPALASDLNVITFKIPPSRRTCAKALEGAKNTGPVLNFPPRQPPFLDAAHFLGEMHAENLRLAKTRSFYFYFSGLDFEVFLNQTSPQWTREVRLNDGPYLYILKATPRGENAHPTNRSSLLSLRSHYHLEAFTKVRVPRLYSLVRSIIEHSSLLEDHLAEKHISTVNLDYSPILSSLPHNRKLEAVVNSWDAKTPHELKIKWMLKDFLFREPLSMDDRLDCSALAEALTPLMQQTYTGTRFANEVLLSVFDICDR